MSEEINKIREALIERARKEANEIIEKAKEEAKRIIEKALREKEEKIRKIKEEIVEEAKRKAEEEVLSEKIEAKKKIAHVKNKIINEVWSKVRERIEQGNFDREKSLRKLLLESLEEIPSSDIIIYVNKNDKPLLEKILQEIVIKKRIINIRECDILGGVIVESADSLIRIDNSYDTRLSSVKYRHIHAIARKLFGVD